MLRGLQDTRTPLTVAIVTNLANIALNVVFVYGLSLGTAGSALGTLVAQTGAAVFVAAIVIRGAERERASCASHQEAWSRLPAWGAG